MNYAIDEIVIRLLHREEYEPWLAWASEWKAGERMPAHCVKVGRYCLNKAREQQNGTWHCLGQLAWAGKEACYNIPTSGWLVIRYIADAMVAFGVPFPENEGLENRAVEALPFAHRAIPATINTSIINTEENRVR